MQRQIILASQSKQRLLLFEALGLEFEVIPSLLDEKQITATSVEQRAELISRAKAEHVQAAHPQAIVIAADTYGVLDGRILEKPETLEEAIEMLEFQSGKELTALTGLCYLDAQHSINYSTVEVMKAQFRSLTRGEIEYYVQHNPVTTWSAAFSPAYPAGAQLIARMTGSFTGFTYGIPLELVMPKLKESGVI